MFDFTGLERIRLFQFISMGKISLTYKTTEIRAKLQNELNAYLKVLLYIGLVDGDRGIAVCFRICLITAVVTIPGKVQYLKVCKVENPL